MVHVNPCPVKTDRNKKTHYTKLWDGGTRRVFGAKENDVKVVVVVVVVD